MTPESQSAPERFGSRRSSVMLKCGQQAKLGFTEECRKHV